MTEGCFRGAVARDCGQGGEPTLACSNEECLWFLDGCVPEDYVASACPVEDICCEHPGTSSWPFPGDSFVEPLFHVLYGWGLAPWTRDRGLVVGFDLDPDLPSSEPFVCDGMEPSPNPGSTPCRPDIDLSVGWARVRDTLELELVSIGGGGWKPAIEVDPERGKARVCTYFFSDGPGAYCPQRPVVCASSGTVWLSSLPTSDAELESANLRVRLDVEFADVPLHLTGGFTVVGPRPR